MKIYCTSAGNKWGWMHFLELELPSCHYLTRGWNSDIFWSRFMNVYNACEYLHKIVRTSTFVHRSNLFWCKQKHWNFPVSYSCLLGLSRTVIFCKTIHFENSFCFKTASGMSAILKTLASFFHHLCIIKRNSVFQTEAFFIPT